MNSILLVILSLGFALNANASDYEHILNCRVGTGEKQYTFKQEVDLTRQAAFYLGDIIEIDPSLRNAPSHYPIIAVRGDINVALWLKHPNLLTLTVFEIKEGASAPKMLSESYMVRSDEIYSIYATTYLEEDNHTAIRARCDITPLTP